MPERRQTVSRRSVDLPAPGCPPIRTTAPGTIPPPRTRSNSRKPVLNLGSSASGISDRISDSPSPADPAKPLKSPPDGALLFGASLTSVIEFQAPHSGHFPIHLGKSAPHSEQT